jgi:hypothetical protein
MMSEYKEIIVALIAVFGVVIPYLLQRNKEHKLKLAERKREAYGVFLRNFIETALRIIHEEDVPEKEADKERMLARAELLLYASDDVIKAYDAWIKYADDEKRDMDKEGELVNDLFLAIRKDLLGTTKVTAEELSNLNPFIRG